MLKIPEGLSEKDSVAYAKAVEAELVYCVRKETGKWPLAQHEIHFNNEYPGVAGEIAGLIYASLGG